MALAIKSDRERVRREISWLAPSINMPLAAICQLALPRVLEIGVRGKQPLFIAMKRAFGKGAFWLRHFVSKFPGVSLWALQVKRDVPGNMGLVPCATPSLRSLSECLERSGKARFGKGILSRSSSECSFSVPKARRNMPWCTRHVPPETLGRKPNKTLLFPKPNSLGS